MKGRSLSAALFLCILAAIHGVESSCTFYAGVSDCRSPHTGEIYKEVKNGNPKVLCCEPDTDDYKYQRKQATKCRNTECVSSSELGSGNTCDSFDERYMDGKKVSYDEIATETCKTSSGGKGLAGLCCVKDSLDGLLATTLGAEPNEFPHIVKLQLPGHCGGTIYNKKFIITAAHCIVDKNTNQIDDVSTMKVVLGSNIGNSEQYVIKVARAIPHYNYSRNFGHPELKETKSYSPRTYNDIALLELEEEITFGPNVKSLQIAPAGFQAEEYADKAVIAGWGTTDTGDISDNLQRANFIIRSDPACFQYNREEKKWGPHGEMKGMEDQLLCVGGILDGKWSPTAGGGDSGGPAICRGADGRIVLCGVTSFGGDDDDCMAYNNETSCLPSVYAEVGNADFQQWITKEAGEQDPSTFYQPYLYGEPVKQGKYVHQVHITSSNGKPCGGTLIAPDVVVTAAQCVYDSSGKSRSGVKVMSGTNDLKGKGKMHSATSIMKRNGFELVGQPVNLTAQGNRVRRTDDYYKNDLAILKLKEPANISPKQIPELAETRSEFGTELAFPRDTKFSSKLMARDFKILEQGQCQRRMDRLAAAGASIKVDSNLLCGVEKYSGGSTCDRELGGGLICKGKGGKEQLCGVQVFRLCEWSIPNGFMDMSYYKDWLDLNVPRLT